MIVAIGTDLVDGRRIERLLRRFGPRFERRILSPTERRRLPAGTGAEGDAARARAFARRFSQKEAVVKALGTGVAAGIGWHQIEIGHDEFGAPRVLLHGRAAARLQALGGDRVFLTTSDERPFAVSFAVIESAPPRP